MSKYLILLFYIYSSLTVFSQELTPEEGKLYSIIMEYRIELGLPEIPISNALTKVAQLHCEDLAKNHPDTGICNLHSWSNQGIWSSCCYTDDHAKASCMWDKPKELTSYNFPAYEIASSSSGLMTSKMALDIWKKSKPHNDVITNNDIWKEQWKAIGIGIQGSYAVVWFGNYLED